MVQYQAQQDLHFLVPLDASRLPFRGNRRNVKVLKMLGQLFFPWAEEPDAAGGGGVGAVGLRLASAFADAYGVDLALQLALVRDSGEGGEDAGAKGCSNVDADVDGGRMDAKEVGRSDGRGDARHMDPVCG